MRSKLLIGGVAAVAAFLLATNSLVAQAAAFITSADIVNNTIKSKDVKNNALKGKDVKDNSLTGADIADGSLSGGDVQVRVAAAADDDNALTGTSAATPVLTTVITAPSKGYLVIDASSDVFGDDVGSDCWIALNGVEYNPSERSIGNTTNVFEVDCATNATIPVAAGAHTVQLVADPGSTSVIFDEATLSALFVPFGATGAAPAKAASLNGNKAHGN